MQREETVQGLCQMVKKVLIPGIAQIYHMIMEMPARRAACGQWAKNFGNDYYLVGKRTLHKN
jgi:hypothetical protein